MEILTVIAEIIIGGLLLWRFVSILGFNRGRKETSAQRVVTNPFFYLPTVIMAVVLVYGYLNIQNFYDTDWFLKVFLFYFPNICIFSDIASSLLFLVYEKHTKGKNIKYLNGLSIFNKKSKKLAGGYGLGWTFNYILFPNSIILAILYFVILPLLYLSNNIPFLGIPESHSLQFFFEFIKIAFMAVFIGVVLLRILDKRWYWIPIYIMGKDFWIELYLTRVEYLRNTYPDYNFSLKQIQDEDIRFDVKNALTMIRINSENNKGS